ncbi:MAG: DUF4394 domain-containing protein [Variovorax sp.]|nr:MAG: DUF4394 domain-containing protein [Variovorax sp.]
MTFQRTSLVSALTLALFSLAACGGGGGGNSGGFFPVSPPAATPTPTPAPEPTPEPVPTPEPAPVAVGNVIALTTDGKLISFDRAAPAVSIGSVDLRGLASGEILLGIDVRPADGKLYGLGNTGNLYTLDAATGIATLKSTLKALAGDNNPYTTLNGTTFGIDFNPVADRLRVVSDTGLNLRINVDSGDTTTDGTITPASSSISAVAYTNSFAGTTTTQLFDLDVAAGQLFLQDPPNNGTLAPGVALGVAASTVNGFDVDARTNVGYAALKVGSETALYSINLAATSAAATRIGAIAGGADIRGIALAPAVAPTALALTADNTLVAFDPKAPNTLTATTPITGLGGGESVVGMDFRPKDGLLYALTSAAKLYTIDPQTGASTLRAALVADPGDSTLPYIGLTGTRFSVDFNPAADRLRVISDTGLNLRIVVETTATVTAGNTTTDTVLARASGTASVVASAYTNSFAGTLSTALYNLEQNTDQLTLQSPPNDGTLTDVGALGLDISGAAGLDIAGGANGLPLAALRAGTTGPFTLYTVTLATGAAALFRNTSGNAALSLIGGTAGPTNLIDLAIKF